MSVYVHSTYACNAAKLIKKSCTAWRRGPVHASDGLSPPRSCSAQEHEPRHHDAHALPWHQHDTDRNDPGPSVSSKRVAETESPEYHVLRGVQEFSCLVGLLQRQAELRSTVFHPQNTNFLTPFGNQVSNVTISRKAPSGNPTSKPTSTVSKRQSTLPKEQQQTQEGIQKEAAAHLRIPPRLTLSRPGSETMTTLLPPNVSKPASD